jgi:enamine deaminase RidA (YjgF/YER057c/UK114 family)
MTSGLTARVNGIMASEDFAGQVAQVLSTLDQILRAHGLTSRDVFAVSVYLADIDDLATFNANYRTFFDEPYPVRTTIQCGLGRGVLVEINAQASFAD